MQTASVGDLKGIKQTLKLYFFRGIWRVEFRAVQIIRVLGIFCSTTEWQNQNKKLQIGLSARFSPKLH